jgi:hypothetical protein
LLAATMPRRAMTIERRDRKSKHIGFIGDSSCHSVS